MLAVAPSGITLTNGLRLVIGSHFFSEGLEKIERDSTTGQYRITFSAAGFLSQAKGPLAGLYHSLAPDGHDWQTLLAVPHQNRPLTAEEAKAAGNRPPYQDWADRIGADWQAILDTVAAIPGRTDDQLRQAKAIFELRQQELQIYLASESAAIAEYQHELWRLGEWRAKPEAASVPFQQERIANKAAETSAAAKLWVAQVDELEQNLLADLREILTPGEQADGAPTSPEQHRLNWVNLVATVLTLGVGICLLLGLFTRLASLAGALFLLSIIATQPPWLPTAEPTIYQTVELAGLLVLAGTGAGRWLGLDYFTWALFRRHHH